MLGRNQFPRLCVTGSITFELRRPKPTKSEVMNETHCTRVCFGSRLLANPPGLRRLRFSFFRYSLVKEQKAKSTGTDPLPRINYPQVENKQESAAQLAVRSLASVPEMATDDHSTAVGQRSRPCSEDGLITPAGSLSTTFSNFFGCGEVFPQGVIRPGHKEAGKLLCCRCRKGPQAQRFRFPASRVSNSDGRWGMAG